MITADVPITKKRGRPRKVDLSLFSNNVNVFPNNTTESIAGNKENVQPSSTTEISS